MKPIRVTIRREKGAGELVLFFKNTSAKPENPWVEITGFSRSSGHFQVHRDYMQRRCTPVDPTDPDAVRLAQFWETIGPDRYRVKIARRL